MFPEEETLPRDGGKVSPPSASALSSANSGAEQACRATAKPREGQDGVGRGTDLVSGGQRILEVTG